MKKILFAVLLLSFAGNAFAYKIKSENKKLFTSGQTKEVKVSDFSKYTSLTIEADEGEVVDLSSIAVYEKDGGVSPSFFKFKDLFPNVTSVSLCGGIIASGSLADNAVLEEIELDVESVESGAFSNCSSVSYLSVDGGDIKSGAFVNNTSLSEIDFNEAVSVGSNAFQNCDAIEIIYINTTDKVVCAEDAFPETVYGTNGDSPAELYIAMTNEYLRYYTDPDYEEKSGWQNFKLVTREIQSSGSVWRTYSNTVATEFPKYELKGNGSKKTYFEVYYVVGVKGNHYRLAWVNKSSSVVVPKNTGVLIHYKGTFTFRDCPDNTDEPIKESTGKISYGCYDDDGNWVGGEGYNYLESMQDAPSGSFYMSYKITTKVDRGYGTDYTGLFLDKIDGKWSFYTINGATYTKDKLAYKAFLRIPTELYEQVSSYTFSERDDEVVTSAKAAPGNAAKASASSVCYELVDGLLPVSESVYETLGIEAPEVNETSETTAIETVTEPDSVNDNKYYNLMGVEVKSPKAGFYIYNGKKVVVK